MGMACVKSTVMGLLSCGPSQVVGFGGLTVTGSLSLWNVVKKIFYQLRLKQAGKTQTFYDNYKNKVTKCNRNLGHCGQYAKLMGCCLIPVAGLHLAAKFGKKASVHGVAQLGKVGGVGTKLTGTVAFPLAQRTKDQFAQDWANCSFATLRADTLKLLRGEQVLVPTADGRQLDGIWIKSAYRNAPTVLVYHGNGSILDGMAEMAHYFWTRGNNVLLITIGGYPNSAEGTPTSELSLYHDAQAAVNYAASRVQNVDPTNMLAYGLSLGGALACHAAAQNPGMHLIADQTFTSVEAIVGNVSSGFTHTLATGLAQSKFPVGVTDGTNTTDGMNNMQKVKGLLGSFLAIYSSNDRMMTAPDGHNLAEDLAKAYLAEQHQAGNTKLTIDSLLIKLQGDHCTPFLDTKTAEVDRHLQRFGFLRRHSPVRGH